MKKGNKEWVVARKQFNVYFLPLSIMRYQNQYRYPSFPKSIG